MIINYNTNCIELNKWVQLEDLETGTKEFYIISTKRTWQKIADVFNRNCKLSCSGFIKQDSPIAIAILGKKINDNVSFKINGKSKNYRIGKILS